MNRLTPIALLFVVAGAASAQQPTAFPTERIARARAFWEANAASADHMDCITTLNHAVRVLFDDPLMNLGSQIDRTMGALQGMGLAGQPKVIEFNAANGKPTTGVVAPATLRESVWDGALRMVGTSRGWNVFGMSLMDGYHSVALSVDTSNPASPKIYWCDQWSTNGGFRLHTKESLDAEVTRLTTAWWSADHPMRTRCTLWRLTPTNSSRVAAVLAGPLNIRSAPSPTATVVERAPTGKKFRVLSQRGLWLEVERSDGSRGWVHSAYVRTSRGVAPVAGTVVASIAPTTHDPPATGPTAPEPHTTGLLGAVPQ